MKNLLISFLIILSACFIALQLYGQEFYAATVRAILILGLTLLYLHVVKTKRFWFSMFLSTFLAAELLVIVDWYNLDKNFIDNYYLYYGGNGLYIISYIFLIVQVIKTMDIGEVVRKYPLHILVLLIMDAFCVFIVTDTVELNKIGSANKYVLEFTYNTVIMVLLSMALLNYIYRDDKKSMNFLIGSIFIVFSEVIQFAYFYLEYDFNVLNVVCSVFLVMAFLFFYLQARMVHENNELAYQREEFKELET